MARSSERQPLYQRIYQYLIDEVSASRLQPGDRVPSENELAKQFRVSRITSKKALEMLADRGTIERVPGKGSFVASSAGRSASEPSRTTSANLIGVVLADFDDSFGTRLLHGIEQECRRHDYHPVLHRTRDIATEEEQAIEYLESIGVQGILVMPVHGEHYNPAILKLVLKKFPLVFVDRHLRGLAASSVGTDNVAAAQLATDHLLEMGHRNIAFVSPPTENTSTIEDRLDGFVRSHAEHGSAIEKALWLTNIRSNLSHVRSRDHVEEDIERVKLHLRSHPEITAVFASEYTIACIVEIAAEQLGRSIPGQLSVVCFDSPEVVHSRVHFTHIKQHEFEIGERATRIIFDHVKGNAAIEKVRLTGELVFGESTVSRS